MINIKKKDCFCINVPDYNLKLLTENGFKDITFVKATEKNSVYLAKLNDDLLFLKITSNPEKFDNIRTEVIANNFIRRKAIEVPLQVPKSTLLEREGYVIGCFEYVRDGPLASQEKHKIFYSPDKKDLSKIYAILKFFASIKKNDVPKYLLDKIKTVHNEKTIRKKIPSALNSLGGAVSQDQKKKFEENVSQMQYKSHFNHHDFALWNMFNGKQGDFILVDSEFARWGIKWYDEAYLFLQTYVSLESPLLAKNSLEYLIESFKKTFVGKNIDSEIMLPLHYIIIPSILEAKTKRRKMLAEDMFNRILTMDIYKVLK